MASNLIPRDDQWAPMGLMSPVRSLNVNPVKPPVWVDRTAVGSTAHSTPAAEIMGKATVREHFPTQEMS